MNTSSRMVKCSVKLSDFGLDFSHRKAIKVQDLTDFIVESSFINHLETEDGESLKEVQETTAKSSIKELPKNDTLWVLYVDGSSIVILAETSLNTQQMVHYANQTNKAKLWENLDFLDVVREQLSIQIAIQAQQVAQYYYSRVHSRHYQVGDLEILGIAIPYDRYRDTTIGGLYALHFGTAKGVTTSDLHIVSSLSVPSRSITS
ncbi:hypothetical protein Gogos_017049 [Gossypium gossypioides]|uniref:Uncharacterized protein n=1 Tax=Gossypium gossypioides TaxID=34282 RepID=A0A7J9B9M4_GOSGO|nr:hypothetical protein [Gossypium gossypioides]